MRLSPLAAALALPLALLATACGSDSGPAAPTADTVSTPDTIPSDDTTQVGADTTETAPPADTVAPVDTTPIPVAPHYPAYCTDKGFKAYSEQFGDLGQGVSAYQAVSRTREPYNVVSFEFYPGFGDSATGPGTYDLTGSNYETCSNCVLVRTGCTEAGGCAKTYYADEGKLVIDQWAPGELFSGHLEGAVLREVTIDSETYHSTPVAGGGIWCLDQYQFAAPIKKPVVGGENLQPVCVADGTGTLVHDNIANYSLPNCYGDMVNLHDTCGQGKALWLMGTAGWCSACKDLINALVAEHGGSLSRAKVAEETPGLDLIIVLGEDNRGANPSQAYCQQYAEGLKLDPAMVVIDHDPAGQDIPLIDPVGYAIPVNSFATTWANINPYLVAEGESVTTATPWHMVLRTSNMEYIWSDNSGGGSLEGAIGELLSE